MREQVRRQGGSAIVFDADAVAEVGGHLFDPAHWQAQGAITGSAAGRGAVHFIRAGDGEWVLRHYRRGGWAGRVVSDTYAWTGLAATRPFREFRLTAQLRALGLPVPSPVAARVQRRGLAYRGDLITARIPRTETLADFLAREPLPLGEWHALGALLRRFHEAGLRHDDINARNVLRDDAGGFHLIDLDKARRVPGGAWQARNLARFRRSLDKFLRQSAGFHFSAPDWEALEAGYRR